MPLQIKNAHVFDSQQKATRTVSAIGFTLPVLPAFLTAEYVMVGRLDLLGGKMGDVVSNPLKNFRVNLELFAGFTQTRTPEDSITFEELERLTFTTDEAGAINSAVREILITALQGQREPEQPKKGALGKATKTKRQP